MDDLNSFTYFSETDFNDNGSLNLQPVNIKLLPGETFKQFDLLNYGCRFGLTNYRIIIISDIMAADKNSKNNEKYNIISIPLGLIYHIEYYGMVCVNILTKIGCRFSLTFPDIDLCERTLKQIKEVRLCENIFGTEFYRVLKDDFPSHFLINGIYSCNDWKDEIHIIENEFQRLKFPLDLWRISNVNKEFKICNSYPQLHIVLKQLSDYSITDMAKFRSKNRFISAVYRSIDTGALLLRAGQPLTGVSGWRNNSDEEYFSLINSLNQTNGIIVFDARSYTSAQLNKVKGGGIESETYYPSASVEFLNIPNMHTVRSSFESLSSAMSCDIKNFYDLVDKSGWLLLMRDLLKSANSICNIMHTEGKSALVHCSDGWDRTPQLTSLTMLLLDPFYRTIKGFKILIQREWIYFGHRFNERCALSRTEAGKEFSPIFLQWLDCIHQLQLQFVDHFEFNEKFLIKLALHVYSGLFGTFNKSIYLEETCSLWNFLCNKDIRAFINPFYHPNKTFNVMKPIIHLMEMKLWVGLFRDALDPNYRQIHSSENLNRDLPPELNNLIMMNSIINDKDQDDDYEGEDVDSFEKCEIPVPNDLRCTEDSDNLMDGVTTKVNDNVEKSFFRNYLIKSSLKSIEDVDGSPDICFTQDLDFDGLVIQKDILFTYCETNRQNRHLLQRRNHHYKNELLKMYNVMSKKNEITLLEKDINEIEEEVLCEFEEDNITIISDMSNLEDIVLWMPDHAVTNCALCHEVFGIFNRKHHCRNCGKIFCKRCSSHKSKVFKQRIIWPERVCNICYNDLNNDVSNPTKKKSIMSVFGELFLWSSTSRTP